MMSDIVLNAENGNPADSSGETAEPARFFRRSATLQSPHEALYPETPPPPPPHRRRPRLSAVSGFLSFLLLVAVASFFALLWAENRLHEPGPLTSDKVVFIERGAVFDILSTLESEGVIDSAIFVNAALWMEGRRESVKAGEYLFHAKASIHDVIDTLISGKEILHKVTIPEGLTSEQIVQLLRNSDVLVGDIREAPKEGSLLPETYKVARGMSRSDLVRKMQDDQKHVLEQIWARRTNDLPLHSPYELVTLASIVEKETGKADERPRVARVFLNRLQKRMRLQSDPTIVYGIVGGRGTLGRPISRAELDKPTSYNTYIIDGLPPGPIANPGRAALEAVANPSLTQELYFVADGTGGHAFAESLEQHNRNVQRWRQIEKDREKATPEVDRFAPPTAPVRTDQKGELDNGADYGALPASIATADAARNSSASLDMEAAAAAIAKVAPKMPAAAAFAVPGRNSADGNKTNGGKKPNAEAPSAVSAFVMGPGLDELGITVRGIGPGRAAAELLDGPMRTDETADSRPDPTGIAASAVQRTEFKAKAAKLAADPTSDILPPNADTAEMQSTPPAPQKFVRAKVIDVSEGSPIDPLLDHTYDLNYAKTVPSFSTLR
ncbi:MAG: endolytic transglycosylase MltG [Beijerinckiaceae bacterium]